MGSITSEEQRIFLFAVDDLTGIVTQCRRGITVWRLGFMGGVSNGIFKVVFFRGCHDGRGVNDEGIQRDEFLLNQALIEWVMNLFEDGVWCLGQETIELRFIRQISEGKAAQFQ